MHDLVVLWRVCGRGERDCEDGQLGRHGVLRWRLRLALRSLWARRGSSVVLSESD